MRTLATSSAVSEAGTPIVSAIGAKCLDDNGDLTTNFNKIQIWQCNSTTAQQWSYTAGTLVGPGGKCLDVHYDDQAAGTVVDLYQCNGTNAQKWTIHGTAIESVDGYCLDVKGGVNANGTQVQIADCDGSESQVWHVSDSSDAGGEAPCTFDGKTVASGSHVSPNPFESASVPYGETCTAEVVTCEDGVLTPSNASPTCIVEPAPSTRPSLRQYNVEQTIGGSGVWEVDSSQQFKMPTQKGNTIWVVATIPNDGAQGDVTVRDTQGNTFIALNFEQDNSQGHQSVWQFYASDIRGDSSTPDTVTVVWGNDNYKGILIAEVAGVTATSLVGHNATIQDYDAPAGSNTVTSGPVSVSASATPALLLAVSMDTYGGTSDEGGDGDAGPVCGNGFTQEDYMWNWDPGSTCAGDLPCNLGAFETVSVVAAGDAAGLFTARAPKGSSAPGTYVTVAAAFH